MSRRDKYFIKMEERYERRVEAVESDIWLVTTPEGFAMEVRSESPKNKVTWYAGSHHRITGELEKALEAAYQANRRIDELLDKR